MYWYNNSRHKFESDSLMAFCGLEEPEQICTYLYLHNHLTDTKRIPYKIDKELKRIEVRNDIISDHISNMDTHNSKMDSNTNNCFEFSHIFDSNTSLNDMKDTIVTEMVRDIFEGYNTSLVTYGPKHSGKTYSLYGNAVDNSIGLSQMLFNSIFDKINEIEENLDSKVTYIVKISFIEVWLDKLYDLLLPANTHKPPSLKIHHVSKYKGLPVENLRQIHVSSYKEIIHYYNEAMVSLNSRHEDAYPRTNTIFNINLEKVDRNDESITSSAIYLVDLAGSDLVNKNNSTGLSLDDTKKLNASTKSIQQIIKSLSEINIDNLKKYDSSLENIIAYDSSKLGKLLIEPLGGNCKSKFIFPLVMNSEQYDEIINCLKIAHLTSKAKSTPQVNKFGLNEKKTLDIALQNFKLKEENFKRQQLFFIHELDSMQTNLNNIKKSSETSQLKELENENIKLKSQLSTLTQLFSNPKEKYPPSTKESQTKNRKPKNVHADESYESIVVTLMEKCQKLADTELLLDDKHRDLIKLQNENEQNKSKFNTAETLNSHLLDRITNLELQLKKLSSDNAVMEKEVQKWSHLNESFAYNKYQEQPRSEGTPKKYSFRRPSLSSSLDSTMEQIEEEQEEESDATKSSWFFGTKKTPTKAKRSVSTGSTFTPSSTEKPSRISSMKGLDLHVMKFASK